MGQRSQQQDEEPRIMFLFGYFLSTGSLFLFFILNKISCAYLMDISAILIVVQLPLISLILTSSSKDFKKGYRFAIVKSYNNRNELISAISCFDLMRKIAAYSGGIGFILGIIIVSENTSLLGAGISLSIHSVIYALFFSGFIYLPIKYNLLLCVNNKSESTFLLKIRFKKLVSLIFSIILILVVVFLSILFSNSNLFYFINYIEMIPFLIMIIGAVVSGGVGKYITSGVKLILSEKTRIEDIEFYRIKASLIFLIQILFYSGAITSLIFLIINFLNKNSTTSYYKIILMSFFPMFVSLLLVVTVFYPIFVEIKKIYRIQGNLKTKK